MKLYVVEQLEKVKLQNEADIKELNKELEGKKVALIEAGKQIEELKNNILKLSQN